MSTVAFEGWSGSRDRSNSTVDAYPAHAVRKGRGNVQVSLFVHCQSFDVTPACLGRLAAISGKANLAVAHDLCDLSADAYLAHIRRAADVDVPSCVNG